MRWRKNKEKFVENFKEWVRAGGEKKAHQFLEFLKNSPMDVF